MSAEKERRDEETIRRLDAALLAAQAEIAHRNEEENHKIMVLRAEVRARSAAAEVAERELSEAHAEIARLKRALEFRRDAEAVPAVSGEVFESHTS